MKVALLTLHGQGSPKKGYSDELKEALEERFGNGLPDISFHEIYYQGILIDNQERYWGQVKNKLSWDWVREWVWHGLGDPGTLESSADWMDGAYALTQVEIAKELLAARAGVGGDRPLVVIAHSLGGQVISNYLWDARKAKRAADDPNKRKPVVGIWADIQHYAPSIKPAGLSAAELAYLMCPGVARLFTTGCNLPLFVSGALDPEPIAKPTDDFEWHNYYDKDDVLGWPIQELSEGYRKLVVDHPVSVGGLLTSWNAFSHGHYWDDDDVLDPLEQALRAFL